VSLASCRVVLVEPRIAANIGATARVMHNFGLSDLVLVNPEADPADREARKLSTQGEEILDRARIVKDFGDAVADCMLVAGTAARVGGPVRRQSVAAPEEVLPRVADALAHGPAALVFGREANGLTDEEVTLFLGVVDASHATLAGDAEREASAVLRAPIEAALSALAAGAVRNGPLVTALHWLALNRSRLAEIALTASR